MKTRPGLNHRAGLGLNDRVIAEVVEDYEDKLRVLEK